jgi:hypothetical protein
LLDERIAPESGEPPAELKLSWFTYFITHFFHIGLISLFHRYTLPDSRLGVLLADDASQN